MDREVQPGIVVSRSILWAAGSAVAVIVGSLGTWVTAGPFSVGGTTQGDGTITLILGIVAVVLVLLERARPLVALVAGAALAVGLIDASSVLRATDDEIFSVGLGWGLIVMPLGAASLLVWAVRDLLTGARRRRVVLLAGTVVAVVLTAGVMAASGRFDVEADEPDAARAETSSTIAEATTDSEASTATEPEPTAADTTEEASEPVVSVGKVGDALVLTGSDDLRMRVTLTDVVDPLPLGEYDSPAAGKRTVGIQLRLTNQSDGTTYDDSPSNGATLIYGSGEQSDAALSVGDCTNPSPRIAPGDSRKICVPFEVDDDAKLSKFQLILDSGFSDDSGEWKLPARVAAPKPSASAAGTSTTNPSLTSCDQNIQAGPDTTCGFADNVFRAYAQELQDSGGSPAALEADSPATGRSYSVTCDTDDGTVSSRATDGGFVQFPEWAAEVY